MRHTRKKIIHLVATARPNFLKIAPLYRAFKAEEWAEPVLIHTGRHRDDIMPDAFFRVLDLPGPHHHLGAGKRVNEQQTGTVLVAYEKVLRAESPDLVVVIGDVNATLAAAIAASKLGFKVAHLEAGVRSLDRTMPEEINRVVTDLLADLLWTPSAAADENLLREGIPPEKIQRVGNILTDSLEMLEPLIEKEVTYRTCRCKPEEYGLITLHRPENVDPPEALGGLCSALLQISAKIPLIFPVHPHTRKNLEGYGLLPVLVHASHVHVVEPLSYLPFMHLVAHSRLVITDSNSLQEEAACLRIPCLNLRPNVERPLTMDQETNRICTTLDLENRVAAVSDDLPLKGQISELQERNTTQRVVQATRRFLERHGSEHRGSLVQIMHHGQRTRATKPPKLPG